jgi:4-diphosphocytidyl-2-C-methyl-D-erythritol kinase
MTVSAPAKLNLHLEVLGRRADGYHELESLLTTVSLADAIEFRRRRTGTRVSCSGESAGPIEENLVTRAVALVREESGRDDGLEVHLEKRIPVGGGLGGGSSDAAATIAGLNEWWGLGWDRDRQADLGARLGSDVPFFFYGPCAVVRGRGERVSPCRMGRALDFVVVAPTERLSTAQVFGSLQLDGTIVPIEPIVDALEAGDVAGIAARLHNRLEEAASGLCEALRRLRSQADAWPCVGHRMTGSGSSYFALCESRGRAESLGRMLESRGLGSVFVVRSG